MEAHVAAPAVQDGHEPDRGAEVLRVCCELLHRPGRGGEEQTVELALILQHQCIELARDGEHGVEMLHVQHILLPLADPLLLFHRLALGAVAVAAGVVGLVGVSAFGADVGVPAQGLGAAFHDRLGSLPGLQGDEMVHPVLVKRGKEHILHLSHG